MVTTEEQRTYVSAAVPGHSHAGGKPGDTKLTAHSRHRRRIADLTIPCRVDIAVLFVEMR